MNPFGYKGEAGYYTDAETGLVLCTWRYYDPATGRWLTRDPIGYAGGINLYGYCGNDPTNAIDPYGLAAFLGMEFDKQVWHDGLAVGATAVVSAFTFHGSDALGFTIRLSDGTKAQRDATYNTSRMFARIGRDSLLLAAGVKLSGANVVIGKYPNSGGFGIALREGAKRLIGLDFHPLPKMFPLTPTDSVIHYHILTGKHRLFSNGGWKNMLPEMLTLAKEKGPFFLKLFGPLAAGEGLDALLEGAANERIWCDD